jgi:AraC-like DNA-binding protein
MVERISVSTRNPEEAVPVLAQFFSGLRMSNPSDQFSFKLQSADDGGLGQIDYHLVSPDSASSVTTDDEILIGHSRRGNLSLMDGREREIDTSMPWVFPQGRLEGRWDDVDMRVISIPTAELRRFVHATVGDETVRFAFLSQPPSPERARAWLALVAVTAAELQRDDLIAQSAIARATRMTHLMMSLVSTFPNTLIAGERIQDRSGILPAAVRRALSFMEDNAQLPITVVEIAEAARLSVRGLQYAFHDHLHTTPVARLRTIRLARVHDELVVSDPSRGATVGAIAGRWGFAHLGRFAQQYRDVYGESPRHTLDRG